jgi:hypothetical protein
LAMNAASTLIAGFGLLENSPAVIIGAMLIAMLFGPILGIALGLAEADMRLVGRSFVSEVVGVLWVLVIGFGTDDAQRDQRPCRSGHSSRDAHRRGLFRTFVSAVVTGTARSDVWHRLLRAVRPSLSEGGYSADSGPS